METLELTTETAKELIKLYNKARAEHKKSFMFEKKEVLVGYAYYLIEYLEMQKVIAGKFDNDKLYHYA